MGDAVDTAAVKVDAAMDSTKAKWANLLKKRLKNGCWQKNERSC
jgi:hypothetical protein